ncbi:MAG: hypothetical protein ACOY5C_08705 [Pseudomonadota bacterium]|uniref:hypothetical protein n=1 Tax=Thermithiobacillus tepidarius TaxID=929 RepID=UPI0012DEB122|nr:hypothetical protein [Thermithiobacillus tepidarius]
MKKRIVLGAALALSLSFGALSSASADPYHAAPASVVVGGNTPGVSLIGPGNPGEIRSRSITGSEHGNSTDDGNRLIPVYGLSGQVAGTPGGS